MKKAEFVEIKGFEGFEVSKEGKIRSTKSRKYKKPLVDETSGREFVRFKKNGSNVTVYVDFILDEAFPEPAKVVVEDGMELTIGKDKKERKARKGCKHILEVETGKIWNGFGGIVNTYGYKYDTFYDKFYYSKTGKVEYEGRKFELVSKSQEV